MGRVSTKKLVNCSSCTKEIYVYKYIFENNKNFFCNKNCQVGFGRIKQNCHYCNKEFEGWKSNENKFCSRDCLTLGRDKTNLKSFTPARSLKISKALKNRKITQEWVDKIKETKHKNGYIPKGVFSKGHTLNLGKTQSKNTKEKISLKHRLNRSKLILGTVQFPNFNPKACQLIEEYGKQNGYNFQHALNGGEYHIKELGYWVDGYDKEKNVVIEYYEKHHSTPKWLEHDIKRRERIIETLKCKFIILYFSNKIEIWE